MPLLYTFWIKHLCSNLSFCKSQDPEIATELWKTITNNFWLYVNYFCIHSVFKPICTLLVTLDGFPGGLDGKVSACNAGDLGSIPGLGRSPGEGMAIHSNTLAWEIPWTEESGRPQSVGSKRVGHD